MKWIVAFILVLCSTCFAAHPTYAPGDLPAWEDRWTDKNVYPTEAWQARSPALPTQARSPALPGRDEFIGERFQAGDTYYDYMSNGTVGKMIITDPEGGVHVTWMDSYDAGNNSRHQKYNCYFEEQWIEDDGNRVNQGTRGGFGSIWLTTEEAPRALVFFHAEGVLEDIEIVSACGVDWAPQVGMFQSGVMPVYPEYNVIWPQGVMSPEGTIHVVYNRRDAGMLSYTSGSLGDNGVPEFPAQFPIQIAETHLNTYRIAQSPNSERVAITWITSRVGIPAPAPWDGFLAYQMNNDVMLAWSDNGRDWNFNDPLNVTHCYPPNPDQPDSVLAYGDTLRPFCTHDVIFDDNDYIHIVFEARGLWEDPWWTPDSGNPPIDALTLDLANLYHWSEETGEITPVADGWFTQQVRNDNDSLLIWPRPGAWKSNVCNPSLGWDGDGNLYCVFNIYPPGDYNDFVAPGGQLWDVGRCNGDVAVTVSEDNGATWYYPTMVTETRSPLAETGEGMCEAYPTLAPVVDDYLHIFYMMDLEAGNLNEDAHTNTNNPMFYHKLAVEEVARDSIFEGVPFHAGVPVGVSERDQPRQPESLRLAGVYPNPFNQRAEVEFELRAGMKVSITVYDLAGREAARILDGTVAAGSHRVVWDAGDLPAGLYLVSLKGGNMTSSLKVALLK